MLKLPETVTKLVYVDHSTTPLNPADVSAMAAAHFAQVVEASGVHGVIAPISMSVADPGSANASFPVDTAAVAIFDTTDHAGAAGYHSVDARGLPYGKVFRDTCDCILNTRRGGSFSLSAVGSHECLELWLDKGANDYRLRGDQVTFDAFEMGDAVEGPTYPDPNTTDFDNAPDLANYLLPSAFSMIGGVAPYDRLGLLSTQYGTLSTGYRIVRTVTVVNGVAAMRVVGIYGANHVMNPTGEFMRMPPFMVNARRAAKDHVSSRAAARGVTEWMSADEWESHVTEEAPEAVTSPPPPVVADRPRLVDTGRRSPVFGLSKPGTLPHSPGRVVTRPKSPVTQPGPGRSPESLEASRQAAWDLKAKRTADAAILLAEKRDRNVPVPFRANVPHRSPVTTRPASPPTRARTPEEVADAAEKRQAFLDQRAAEGRAEREARDLQSRAGREARLNAQQADPSRVVQNPVKRGPLPPGFVQRGNFVGPVTRTPLPPGTRQKMIAQGITPPSNTMPDFIPTGTTSRAPQQVAGQRPGVRIIPSPLGGSASANAGEAVTPVLEAASSSEAAADDLGL